MDVPATGELEYGRGKRKHGKRSASSEQSDAENSIDDAPSRKKTGNLIWLQWILLNINKQNKQTIYV